MGNDKTFVRITNQKIWNKICTMHTDLIKQNGGIKLNRWIAGTALTLAILAISIRFII